VKRRPYISLLAPPHLPPLLRDAAFVALHLSLPALAYELPNACRAGALLSPNVCDLNAATLDIT